MPKSNGGRPRKVGSGLATTTATAVEELLAAHLSNDDNAIEEQLDILRVERRFGRCGVEVGLINAWTGSLVGQLNAPVTVARRALPGGPGDVEAVLVDGSSLWFEVKAQVKKPTFEDLTQADWVRDGTDTLSWLSHHDECFSKFAGEEVGRLLRGRATISELDGWDLSHLWLADVALITSSQARADLGIDTPDDLHAFLASKYLFHMTMSGARLIRLDRLGPVGAVLNGAPASYSLKDNPVSLVSVPIEVEGGGVVFTYHLYAPEMEDELKGRHKLHARATHGAGQVLRAE